MDAGMLGRARYAACFLAAGHECGRAFANFDDRRP
jgi:hypothetical protein